MENGLQIGLQKTPKKSGKFLCDKWYFICSKQSDWFSHLSILKHSKDYNGLQMDTQKEPNSAFACLCGKVYKHRQ